ncbi:uncharacterized protein LOC114516918 isoform X2 [Dendronephthya gigantea]|uniref:uncharacterized protein LOC114516918 isoform X2 n=1 Tax=Dendronephthya gigantea TaxID=151771 RepID=UPI00106BAF86|nr:uncharacterized protein LOC114516918 isoform X2 [Dendronephthya gigantea]
MYTVLSFTTLSETCVQNQKYRYSKWKHCLLFDSKMEGEELFLQACRTPLPPDEDEITESDENEDAESDIEDYLVYDEVSQVCVVCDIVLRSPSHGPLCRRCHSFMYPEYTILQREFDEIRSKSKDKEKYIPYSQYRRPGWPTCKPRHRCGKDGTFRNESVNTAQCSSAEQMARQRTILCFSDSEGEEDEDDELLGLAQMAIYDKDVIQDNATCLEDVKSTITDDFVELMPTEVLLRIFLYLDEIGLCKAAQVCKRWKMLTEGMENWSVLFEKKWPLFLPVGVVECWRDLYVKMVESSTCVPCLEEGFVRRVVADDVPNSWRNKRLRSELKQLLVDPPDGIRACPIDDEYSNWQASIAGPPDSVYENGVFYLHLELPRSYPMMPPRVRFLTRILHPNINRHGDIGIDCLRANWSLALTIPKVLDKPKYSSQNGRAAPNYLYYSSFTLLLLPAAQST